MSKSRDPLADKIIAFGGDPACLHCRLAYVINRALDTTPGGRPHIGTYLGALVECAADMIIAAPEENRLQIFEEAIRMLGNRCGIDVSEIVNGAPPAASKGLH